MNEITEDEFMELFESGKMRKIAEAGSKLFKLKDEGKITEEELKKIEEGDETTIREVMESYPEIRKLIEDKV